MKLILALFSIVFPFTVRAVCYVKLCRSHGRTELWYL